MKRLLLLFTLISSVSFGQTPGGGVTDIDGNTYETVIIGSQEWMAENLKTTTYANGDQIQNVEQSNNWYSLTEPAFCYYDNNSDYDNPYGKLYNWYAADDDRNICPVGWHVPTELEIDSLITYLGGYSVAGGKMKSIGLDYWLTPNTSADNSSGFTALPGGRRADFGDFYRIAEKGYWWSSTEYPSTVFPEGEGIAINISYNSAGVVKYDMEKSYGKSIRCINDSPTSNLTELNSNQPKELVRIVNLLGQETPYQPNTVLIYQYSDGTSEKVFTIED